MFVLLPLVLYHLLSGSASCVSGDCFSRRERLRDTPRPTAKTFATDDGGA